MNKRRAWVLTAGRISLLPSREERRDERQSVHRSHQQRARPHALLTESVAAEILERVGSPRTARLAVFMYPHIEQAAETKTTPGVSRFVRSNDADAPSLTKRFLPAIATTIVTTKMIKTRR